MAGLQELDIGQVNGILVDAAQRRVPATVTLRQDDRWINLRTRLIDCDKERIWMEVPTAYDGTPWGLAPAERVGVTFKLRHHKYVFLATVAGQEMLGLPDGTKLQVAAICWPTQMQRLQRRVYIRADVPDGSVVRASLWVGGREDEPAGTTPEKPVFVGRVINLSAGGFQFRTRDRAAEMLDPGDLVGIRIVFGTGEETVFADAQIRHVAPEDEGIAVGLQFVGLEQSDEGRQALRLIGSKVSEFQRLAPRETAPQDIKA